SGAVCAGSIPVEGALSTPLLRPQRHLPLQASRVRRFDSRRGRTLDAPPPAAAAPTSSGEPGAQVRFLSRALVVVERAFASVAEADLHVLAPGGDRASPFLGRDPHGACREVRRQVRLLD